MVVPEILTNGAEVLSTAQLVSMRSRDLCRYSEWLIVSARLLRRHRAWIAGAADDPDEPAVRQRIREFVRGGVLQMNEPLRIWAGKSDGGRQCVVCGRQIVRGQVEYEVTSVGILLLLLDRRCVELWEMEVKEERDKVGNRKALSKALPCAICLKDIPEGAGHFRFGKSRVHVECLRRRGTAPPGVA